MDLTNDTDIWSFRAFDFKEREKAKALELLKDEELLTSFFDRLLQVLTLIEAHSSTSGFDTSLAWDMIRRETVNVMVFGEAGAGKSLLVRTFLSYNVTLFFADVDVVLLRDPRPYIDAALADGAQLLFHTDGFGASDEAIADGGLELPKYGFTPEMNTGLFLATPAALPLAAAWCDALKSDSAFANWLNDQQALNKLLRRGAWMPPRREAIAAP